MCENHKKNEHILTFCAKYLTNDCFIHNEIDGLFKMTLGERIKQARIKAKLNQEQLAEKLGMTQQSLSGIESGKHKQPRNLESIAKALGVSLLWLQFGDEAITKLNIKSLKDRIVKKIPLFSFQEMINYSTIASFLDTIRAGNTRTMDVLLDLAKIEETAELFAIELSNMPSMVSPTHQPSSLHKDEFLILDLNETPQNEDVVLAFHEGEYVIRQYIKEGQNVVLHPLNPQYPIITANEETQIVGVAVKKEYPYRRKP